MGSRRCSLQCCSFLTLRLPPLLCTHSTQARWKAAKQQQQQIWDFLHFEKGSSGHSARQEAKKNTRNGHVMTAARPPPYLPWPAKQQQPRHRRRVCHNATWGRES